MRYMSFLNDDEIDEFLDEAIKIVIQYDRASASLIQRRLSIGYARAARLIDQLQEAGVIGPADGSKPRDVLITSYENFLATNTDYKAKKDSLTEQVVEPPRDYSLPPIKIIKKVKNPMWEPLLAEVISSKNSTNKGLIFPLGEDEKSKLSVMDFSKIKNMIVVGNPQSYKEIFLDTLLTTLILKHTPSTLRLILNDGNYYLNFYNGLPHLLTPVIPTYDKMVSALRWTLSEMDRRYKLFNEAGTRDFSSFNEMSGFSALPSILLVTFTGYLDVEATDLLLRLTSTGARVGIYNVLVFHRLSNQDVDSTLKSNIPNRLVFRTTSSQDSKLAGVTGADKLQLGQAIYSSLENTVDMKIKTIYTPESNVRVAVEAVKKASSN